LTDAVEQKKEEVAAAPESEGPDHLESFYQLIRVRHDVRHELDLPHDGYDELFEQMAAAQEGEGEDVLVFWPRDDFAQLLRRWPELAERLGADWDEHRADLERTLVELSGSSASPPLLLAASVDGLIAFAAELDEDDFGPGGSPEPGNPDVMLAYAEDLEGPVLAWPPGRNDACWCGSGLKYKKCCLPRARL
jgi:SEC-C motif